MINKHQVNECLKKLKRWLLIRFNVNRTLVIETNDLEGGPSDVDVDVSLLFPYIRVGRLVMIARTTLKRAL